MNYAPDTPCHLHYILLCDFATVQERSSGALTLVSPLIAALFRCMNFVNATTPWLSPNVCRLLHSLISQQERDHMIQKIVSLAVRGHLFDMLTRQRYS